MDTKQQMIQKARSVKQIRNPESFVKSLPANFDGIFDWDWLQGAFKKTKIMPTDIDGMVERNNHFLIFETKGVGAKVQDGQRYTFESLIRTRYFTVIVFWGDEVEDWTAYLSKGDVIHGKGKESAFNLVRDWFAFVDTKYDKLGNLKDTTVGF